ncbi:ferredoxin [Mycobacterium vicinigordonae]|uniref:Ferredoxin n=1 Tax=Mycobacterium vicinigordonae TaxID=1719132 RepID=A0A7D6I8Y7_9MYCO|nr:ferredoxin [Mycobacterium vicinigordonae]QLL08716.1 ferredoxin [Mycobacterium vicinigordonae]
MKIVFDRDACEGNAVCIALSPDLFGLDDEGKAIVLVDDVPEQSEGFAADAVSMCPVAALRLQS